MCYGEQELSRDSMNNPIYVGDRVKYDCTGREGTVEHEHRKDGEILVNWDEVWREGRLVQISEVSPVPGASVTLLTASSSAPEPEPEPFKVNGLEALEDLSRILVTATEELQTLQNGIRSTLRDLEALAEQNQDVLRGTTLTYFPPEEEEDAV